MTTLTLRGTVSLVWRAVQAAALLTLFWWILADNAGWDFGVAAITVSTLTALVFPPVPRSWSPVGLVRFAGYFCKQTVLAGLQVAWLACRFKPALQPMLQDYPLQLPAGPARNLFVLATNLLPGTLSADLEHEVVRVHVLSAELNSDLKPLEELIAGLFAIPIAEFKES